MGSWKSLTSLRECSKPHCTPQCSCPITLHASLLNPCHTEHLMCVLCHTTSLNAHLTSHHMLHTAHFTGHFVSHHTPHCASHITWDYMSWHSTHMIWEPMSQVTAHRTMSTCHHIPYVATLSSHPSRLLLRWECGGKDKSS